MGGNIRIGIIVSESKVFCNAAAATAAIKNEDVLTWYKVCQLQFLMLSLLSTILFQYLPPKLKMGDAYPLQVFIDLPVL